MLVIVTYLLTYRKFDFSNASFVFYLFTIVYMVNKASCVC